MKKSIYILFIFLLSSCLGSKKIVEKSNVKKSTQKIEQFNDSIKIELVNQKILDKSEIPVFRSETNNREIDSIVNKMVTQTLSRINFQKTSGNNSYKIEYDKIADIIRTEIEVGETKNTKEKTSNSKTSEKEDSQVISSYIKKVKGIPIIYIIIVLIIVFRKPILSFLAIIYPPLRFTKIFEYGTNTKRISDIERKMNQDNSEIKDLMNKINNKL